MNDQIIPPAVLKVAEALIASGIGISECLETPPREKPYRVAEVAKLLDVHRATVYRDIEAGRCGAFRIGQGSGALRIAVEDFAKYKALVRGRAATRAEDSGTAVAS